MSSHSCPMSLTLPSLDRVVGPIRETVAAGFRRIVSGQSDGQPEWVTALEEGDDLGYFGPGSAAWAVHGAIPTIVGGVRALLLQALHPGALAGVRQHSRYREDGLGRLAGTSRWLTVTTFGDTRAVERECARVRGLHRTVVGSYAGPAGPTPYAASDPDLLRWVHVAFTDSFLAAHQVWGGEIPGGPDAYVREWATAAELVGVDAPPRSAAELQEHLDGYAPILRGGPDAQDTLRFIKNPPLPMSAKPAYAVLFAGAVTTLREEHRVMLGLPPVPTAPARLAVSAMLGGLSLALGSSSPSHQAAQRRIARLAAA